MKKTTKKKKIDRGKVLTTIKQAAKIYKEKLVGKSFLYVFEGHHIEVIYKAENFKHLTGVYSPLGASKFYSYAARGILTTEQIDFNPRHPYHLSERKLKHIEEVANLAVSEIFMLEDITTKSYTYRFGCTDLNFSLCLDPEKDKEGNPTGNRYIAESLRDEDCFSKSKEAYVVTHIFCRNNDEKHYNKLLFMDSNYTINDLSESVKSLLINDLKKD